MLEEEFSIFQKAYPKMTYLKCAPKLDTASSGHQIKCPTKSAYLKTIRSAIQKSSAKHFGIYYTGSTYRHSGDWVVMNDDRKSIGSISIKDIVKLIKNLKFKG